MTPVVTDHESLAEVLVNAGILTPEQREKIEVSAQESGRSLLRVVLDEQVVTESRLVTELARHLKLEPIDPVTTPIHPQVLSVIPAEVARRLRILPMARRRSEDSEQVFMITVNPCDVEPAQYVAELLPNVQVKWYLAEDRRMSEALNLHYGPDPSVSDDTNPEADDITRPTVRMGGSAAVLNEISALPKAPMAQDTDVTEHVPAFSDRPPDPKVAVKTDIIVRSRNGVQSGTAELAGRPSSRIGDFPYRWGKPLGNLGWAVLREARDAKGQRVAIRQLRPDLRATAKVVAHFLGAAPRLVGIQHPNLVTVREVGEHEGHPFVVQEGRIGTDLKQILEEQEKQHSVPMPLALAKRILSDILNALILGHELDPPIPHGGLSASCVWLDVEGHVRLDELGMPRSLPELSKEGAGPSSSIDSDLRAFGRLMMDVLVQKRSLTPAAMQDELSKRNETGAEAWGKLLLRMVSTDPGHRVTSAKALLETIESTPGPVATTDELAMYVEDLTGDGVEATLLESPGSISSSPVNVPIIDAQPKTGWAPDGPASATGLQSWSEQFQEWGEAARDAFRKAPFALQVGLVMSIAVFGLVLVVSALRDDPVEDFDGQSAVPVAERPIESPSELDSKAPPSEARPSLKAPLPVGDAPELNAPAPDAELAFGVWDRTAPEGFAFIAQDGVVLRSTTGRRSKPVRELTAGDRVEIIREIDRRVMVMMPPKGPVGFIGSDEMVKRKPLFVLGRSMGYGACQVPSGEAVDECMYNAKQRSDLCEDACQGRDGTRCLSACKDGFEQCISRCQQSAAEPPPPPKNRRRRRRGNR